MKLKLASVARQNEVSTCLCAPSAAIGQMNMLHPQISLGILLVSIDFEHAKNDPQVPANVSIQTKTALRV